MIKESLRNKIICSAHQLNLVPAGFSFCLKYIIISVNLCINFGVRNFTLRNVDNLYKVMICIVDIRTYQMEDINYTKVLVSKLFNSNFTHVFFYEP